MRKSPVRNALVALSIGALLTAAALAQVLIPAPEPALRPCLAPGDLTYGTR